MTGLCEKQIELETIWLNPSDADVPVSAWQDLVNSAADPNPFFTPAFLLPYLQAFPNGSVRLAVVRGKSSKAWQLAVPIRRRRAGLAVAVNSAWTTHYAPLGTPLLHRDAGPETVLRFVQMVSGAFGLLALPYLPKSARAAQLAGELEGWRANWVQSTERAGHGAGALGNAQLDEAFRGKRRKEMKRQLRRLEDLGPVTVKHLQGDEVVQGFEEFLELEAQGWKGRGGTALVQKPETARFSKDVIQNLSRTNGARIDQIWVGETLAAALVSFIQGGQVFTWKIASDENFAKYSPGAQIAIMAFRRNLEMPGFTQADSLAIPGHSMIEPLWRGRIKMGTLLLAKGPMGRALAALAAADINLERVLRDKARALKVRLKR